MRLHTPSPEGSEGFEARKADFKVVSFTAQTSALDPGEEGCKSDSGLHLRATSRASGERQDCTGTEIMDTGMRVTESREQDSLNYPKSPVRSRKEVLS